MTLPARMTRMTKTLPQVLCIHLFTSTFYCIIIYTLGADNEDVAGADNEDDDKEVGDESDTNNNDESESDYEDSKDDESSDSKDDDSSSDDESSDSKDGKDDDSPEEKNDDGSLTEEEEPASVRELFPDSDSNPTNNLTEVLADHGIDSKERPDYHDFMLKVIDKFNNYGKVLSSHGMFLSSQGMV